MEPEIITIEIHRETAQILSWLVVGVILVSIAFFIPQESNELWPGLNMAMNAAAMYVLSLTIISLREPIKKRYQKIMMFLVFIVLGTTMFLSHRVEDQSKWNAEQLQRILGNIKEGIRTSETPKLLLNTLEVYHRKQMKHTMTLGETFKSLYPKAEVGTNLFTSEYSPGHFSGERDNPLRIFVKELTSTTITLVAQDKFQEGKDLKFKNYDGGSGRSQVRYTLTEKGIAYGTEN